ncbi:MAG: hypothetical protein MUF68_00890 [Cyclobacteriaceae bacterium]|nr:hypothetical protein [Cyclobacteriaceae bacterium]
MNSLKSIANIANWSKLSVMAFATLLVACDDDPEAVNEEELITTVQVDLFAGDSETSSATLTFYDEDGDGPTAPVFEQEGIIYSGTTYSAVATFLNEEESPAEDVTEEILEEANDHLICFTRTGSLATITTLDEDDNEIPLGILSSWTTGNPGAATVKLTLKHQPGIKTGSCDIGETDIEVTFAFTVVQQPL